MELGKDKLDKKKYADFTKDMADIEEAYLDKIKNDVSWFCKKFDYRYESEPWYDAKDAVERAILLLTSGVLPDKK